MRLTASLTRHYLAAFPIIAAIVMRCASVVDVAEVYRLSRLLRDQARSNEVDVCIQNFGIAPEFASSIPGSRLSVNVSPLKGHAAMSAHR